MYECVSVRVFSPTFLCLSAAEVERAQQQDAKHLLHFPHEGGHPHSNPQAGDALDTVFNHIKKDKCAI